jgi:hypothetical protein
MWNYQPLAGKHDFAVYNEETGGDVALVRNFDEPNARLIAAAPDLLAAAQAAVEFFDIFEEQSEAAFGDWHGRRERARAAIAKATT